MERSRQSRLRRRIFHDPQKLADNFVHVLSLDDKRGSDEDMIPRNPFERSGPGIADEAVAEADYLHAIGQRGLRWKRRLGFPVQDEFQADEQATATNVADERMLPK